MVTIFFDIITANTMNQALYKTIATLIKEPWFLSPNRNYQLEKRKVQKQVITMPRINTVTKYAQILKLQQVNYLSCS